MTARIGRRALLVGAALALTGCSAPDASRPVIGPPLPPVETPLPVGVVIPAIGVDSSLEPYGLNPDGSMAVPPVGQPWQASWLSTGVRPGGVGPAVLAGHVSGPVDGQSVPGVFARLHELTPGADVWVDRADGSRVRFAVDRVETHGKDDFPTAEVYGDRPGAELVLVTCGGALGDAEDGGRSYDSNVLAFAHLAEAVQP